MEAQQLKPGDKVRIKTLEQLREKPVKSNYILEFQEKPDGNILTASMARFCGNYMTIKKVYTTYYTLEEDLYRRCWKDWMFDLSPAEKDAPTDTKQYYFHHYKDSTGKLRATVCGYYDGDNLLLSAAACSGKDRFSRKQGRELAKARLGIYPMTVYRYAPNFLPKGTTRGKFFLILAQATSELITDNPYLLISLPKELKSKIQNELKKEV